MKELLKKQNCFFCSLLALCSLLLSGNKCYSAESNSDLRTEIKEDYTLLTNSFFNTPKSVYRITKHYKIETDIIIPSHSTLVFEGGTISGKYSLVGNETKIIAPIVKVFSDSISLKGSWIVKESFPEWFGAKGDGINDDTRAFVECLKLKHIYLSNKTYLVTSIYLSNLSDVSIIGDNAIIKTKIKDLNTRFNVLGNLDMNNRNTSYVNGEFYMSGVTLDGNADQYEWVVSPNPNYYHALALENYKKVTIYNCCFKNTLMCGIRLYICGDVTIRNCSFYNIGTETGKGDEYRTFGSYGWQWEGISLTGWKNINGGNEKQYCRSSSLTVESCFFKNVLNSPVGGANISRVYVRDNKSESLKSSFTEFHTDTLTDKKGRLLDKIDKILIEGNCINKAGAGFINFSGPFCDQTNTTIEIKSNTIDSLYGIAPLHNSASNGSGTKALLVIYQEKTQSKSSIVLQYHDNYVSLSANPLLKEKLNLVYCTGVKKMVFKDSYFDIKGVEKETIFYTEKGKEIIEGCTFDIRVPYSQFSIHTEGDFIMKNNIINNLELQKPPIAVAIIRHSDTGGIDKLCFDHNKCYNMKSLVLLNSTAPRIMKIVNNQLDFEICNFVGERTRFKSIRIFNNSALSNSLDNTMSDNCRIKNNTFRITN